MKVGDIFVRTWHTPSVVNEMYQVTNISKTGKTCTIREIEKHENGTYETPVRDSFAGPEIKECRVRNNTVEGEFVCIWSGIYARKHVEGDEYFFTPWK